MNNNKKSSSQLEKVVEPWVYILIAGISALLILLVILMKPGKNNQPIISALEKTIQTSDSAARVNLVGKLDSWVILMPRPGEQICFIILLGLTISLMVKGWNLGKLNEPLEPDDLSFGKETKESTLSHRYLRSGKQDWFKSLFARDWGPVTYDVSTHSVKAEISEYRGAIHWFKDVTEKLLSIYLIFVFFFFLSKGFGYISDLFLGNAWRLWLISLDINLATSLIGFALIIDGLLLVSAMADAPGIGRSIDSIIVILSGVIVLLIDAHPSQASIVGFSFGASRWLPIGIALSICVLFLVRWITRHHTISELKGC